MSRITQLQSNFNEAIERARSLSLQLEAGQAETPLADHFEQLNQTLEKRPLTVTVLCVDENCREPVLKWLCGQQFALFSMQFSGQIGLMEIQLREKGYSLDGPNGSQNFDNWEDLVEAVKQADLINEEQALDLKLATERVNEVKNLNILMPDNINVINEYPALLTRILRESNVILLAAEPQFQFSEEQQTIVNSLLKEMHGFWPLLPIDELAEEVSIPKAGWWHQLKQPAVSFPPTLITTHVEAALPEFLTNSQNELRQTLQLILYTDKAMISGQALNERLEQDIRKLNSRKKREARKSQSPEYGNNIQLSSQLRNFLTDKITEIGKKLKESSRIGTTYTGNSGHQLNQLIDSMNEENLAMEPGYKSVKVTLCKKYQDELTVFLMRTLKTSVKSDTENLHQRLDKLSKDLSAELKQHTGFVPVLSEEKIETKRLIEDLSGVVNLELKYQGEVPKRGFLQRLGEARKAAFVILMSVSLLAMMGLNLRENPLIGLIIFMVFFGTFVYTFISWKREDAERIDKEIKRIKEEVKSNSQRIIDEFNREKQSRLTDFLDRVKKQWLPIIEKAMQDWQHRTRQESEQQSTQSRQRIQNIDAKLSELTRHQMPVDRLLKTIDDLVKECRAKLNDLAK